MLMPRDTVPMGIDVSMIDDAINISTAGGMSRVFVEPAEAAFVDAETATRYVYRVMLTIAEPLRSTEFVPSLLGRDGINLWRIDTTRRRQSCAVT